MAFRSPVTLTRSRAAARSSAAVTASCWAYHWAHSAWLSLPSCLRRPCYPSWRGFHAAITVSTSSPLRQSAWLWLSGQHLSRTFCFMAFASSVQPFKRLPSSILFLRFSNSARTDPLPCSPMRAPSSGSAASAPSLARRP